MRKLTGSTAVVLMAAGSALAVDVPEVEPNQTKAQATEATLAPGDTVSGTTTGTATTDGLTSVDTFLIRTATAPAGIYRYTMRLTTTGTAGHSASIRGLTQTAAGVITAGTDASHQPSFTQADASRTNVWYGFGRQERVYWRVTGTASTTAPYSGVLERTEVTPVQLGTALTPGQMSIRVTMTGATTDPEFWVYNRDTLAPIAGFNNDDTPNTTPGGGGLFSTLTRDFPAGHYLLAVSDYNLANDLQSPEDENFRGENVMDFPDSIAAGDREGAWTAVVSFRQGIATGTEIATASVSQTQDFEVLWIAFDVGNPGPSCPADIGTTGGVPGADGTLNNNDFVVFIDYFFASNPIADRGTTGGVPGSDGQFNNNDFIVFIDQFFAGCS